MKFLMSFAITYIFISLPDILGFTFVVQWVPGVTDLQKAWSYLTMGLSENALVKLIISSLSVFLFGFIHIRKSRLTR